jgi:hypothetical protein
MIPKQFLQQERSTSAQGTVTAAPIEGWNTRDSLSSMSPLDAIELDNLFPDVGAVISRRGITEHTTGLSGQVETLFEYNGNSQKLLAADSGGDVYTFSETSGGTATSIGSGFSNGRWQTANFNNNGLMVNGADTPQVYNGSTLSAMSFSGDITTASAPENMEGVNVFKNRVYYWSTTERSFFYSASVNTFQGNFTEFPLDRISQTGGNLLAMVTISRDGGAGLDDLAAFVMTTGEVLIYDGDDPGSSFALQGKFQIPAPVSIRGVAQFGGDFRVITEHDFSSILGIIGGNGSVIQPSKLTGAVKEAVRTNGTKYGWEALVYPRENMLIMNVPITENSEYHQYVQNTVTGASCRFKGINARTLAVLNNKLYFGELGRIMQADDGFSDEGANISCVGQQAFNAFGSPNDKQVTMIRYVFNSDAGMNITNSIAFDYATASRR